MIDIRCRGVDPTFTRPGAAGRCQLAAGHEGAHALLLSRGGVRTVRQWSAGGDVVDRPAGQESRPWAPGFPMTAWAEPGRRPAEGAATTTGPAVALAGLEN